MIELERNAPDLEDLAAYLDGRLSDERRTQVEERLLRDEDYYDVFMETVRYREEQGQAEGGGEVVAPAVWWRKWKGVAPLAVAATLVAAVGLRSFMLTPSTGELMARLDVAEIVDQEDWSKPGWPVLRSIPDLESEQRAFRIGTRTVDLRIALAAGDENAASLANRLGILTGNDESLTQFREPYMALREEIGSGKLDASRRKAAELEQLLAEGLEGTAKYELGKWNEIGRLGALTGDAEVLRDLWRQRRVADGIADIQPQYQTLEELLEPLQMTILERIKSYDSPETEIDFATAEEAFRGIAKALADRR